MGGCLDLKDNKKSVFLYLKKGFPGLGRHGKVKFRSSDAQWLVKQPHWAVAKGPWSFQSPQTMASSLSSLGFFLFTCNESHYKAPYECDLRLRRNQWKPLESVNVYLPFNATHTAFGATWKSLWSWGMVRFMPTPPRCIPTPKFLFYVFSPQIWSLIRHKLRNYFQTRTHKPFGWVAIHLGRKKRGYGSN